MELVDIIYNDNNHEIFKLYLNDDITDIDFSIYTNHLQFDLDLNMFYEISYLLEGFILDSNSTINKQKRINLLNYLTKIYNYCMSKFNSFDKQHMKYIYESCCSYLEN